MNKPGYIIFARGYDDVLIIEHSLDGWLNVYIKRFCTKMARKPYKVYRFDGTTRETRQGRTIFSGKVRILNVHKL